MTRTRFPTVAGWLPIMVYLALSGACEPMPSNSLDGFVAVDDVLPAEPFAAPEGVAVIGDFVVVANTNFGYSGQALSFGQGFLTVIDRTTHEILNRITLPVKNPQVVATGPGPLGQDGANTLYVWVLCSGETTFDGENLMALTDGALVGIAVGNLTAATSPDIVVPIERSTLNPLVGYPSSLVVVGSRAWIGSGTSAAVFVVDLMSATMIRGPQNPIILGRLDEQDTMVIAEGSAQRLVVGSFNRDRVFFVDTLTMELIDDLSFDVGNPAAMDGILSIVVRPDNNDEILVLLGLSNLVVSASFAGEPSDDPVIDNHFSVTGSLANVMLADDDRILVINSGDNNVTAFDSSTGHNSGFVATCPTSSNPYSMAIAEVGTRRELYVTCLLSNSLVVFDADTGDMISQVN